ncbi:hypothetical protein O7617_23880 [Micromonospora sp. WMMD1155]|nr:hypothetical protein O7617_23880 [Micromonospora sp. WMMD1155]
MTVLAGLLQATPATAAAEEEPTSPNRSMVVAAWRSGGAQVRLAAETALVGSDDQIRDFLDDGWQSAQATDERDAIAGVIGEAGPSVRDAANQALVAAEAGNPAAITTFLAEGWQGPSNIDLRVSVNRMMVDAGPQLRQVAQQALDSEDPTVLRDFLNSGWQVQWLTDQRLRVNQAMSTGGPQVQSAAQRALDHGTPEALEAFLEYGWAVASARDEETGTLVGLVAQAQAAGELAAQETQHANQEAARAKAAADAARRAAGEAAQATAAARNNMTQAAAHAKRAAVAAEKAAQAAKVAVQAAAAASRAARAAASAASRAASAASRAGQAAARAYRSAADAARDETKAADARRAADTANRIAQEADSLADKAHEAGQAIEQGLAAIEAAKSAANHARQAADANDEAARHAGSAGADASAAIAAAQRARANADRAARAAQAAERYLRVAISSTFAARDAARQAAGNARAAARAAIEAAEHAGEAAEAARRATEYAIAATAAAQAAVDTSIHAFTVFEAAREADAERLAVASGQGLEFARAANAEYENQQRAIDWDVEQAAQRDAETNRLIAEAQNPATPPEVAATAGRRVALALASARGTWTREAALAALESSDEQVLEFVRTTITRAAGRDDRQVVMNLAVSDNAALSAAALTALAGSDATVTQFLRTQNYPGRYARDRTAVNQILESARGTGDVVLMQRAQEALDAETLPALRDFLDTGQYTAAAIGERVRVNNILAHPASGPEIKAAAQIALDGPPPGLRQFLSTGQYLAAERDHDSAVHVAVAGGLVEQINQIAETAVQNAFEAQASAAQARGDAEKAAEYANRAIASATRAAEYATRANGYANQAAQSVEKAATAVATAKDAATRANSSARSAIRSATWAITSHHTAVKYAAEANAAATRAYASAVRAGMDAEAAVAAAREAYDAYDREKHAEIAHCHTAWASGPALTIERLLRDEEGSWFRNCARNVIADPVELATRGYTNESLCGVHPEGSRLYDNCLDRVHNPNFGAMEPLFFLTESIKGLTATLVPLGIIAAGACLATLVCGAVAGTLLTLADVGLNLHRLINGDQSLAGTLLNLGQAALEALVIMGIGKLVDVGFRNIRALYIATQNAKRAETGLWETNQARVRLMMLNWIRGCSGPEVNAASGGFGQLDNDRPSRIIAADTRPFWMPDHQPRAATAELPAGQWLRTSSGSWVQADRVAPRATKALVHNFTAADDAHHTGANLAPVLVQNDSCFLRLTDLGANWYRTPAGLNYGPGSKHGHYILHVLDHAYPNPAKSFHTVFLAEPSEILKIVDEAWNRRDGNMLIEIDDRGDSWWAISMGRQIGTAGERHICLVVRDIDRVVTAYPIANPAKCRRDPKSVP